MPMGIVSDSEFDSALTDVSSNPGDRSKKPTHAREESTPVQTIIMPTPEKGRGVGNIEVPNALRNVIGQTAVTEGRGEALDLAKRFGLSPSAVSAYANGATSTASYEQTPNKPTINSAKERVAKRARGKLMRALHHITNDKLEVSSAKDLAGIAKDMSAVVKQMEPEQTKSPTETNGPTFIFYAPQMKRESDYEVIHIKE